MKRRAESEESARKASIAKSGHSAEAHASIQGRERRRKDIYQ